MNPSEIDDLTRPDHPHLRKDDRCFYLRTYTPRRGYGYSATNQDVLNLKKPVSKKGFSDWKYKQSAIQKVASAWREVLEVAWLRSATLVPIPPSKTKDDVRYDDRLTAILKMLDGGRGFDIRELIIQTQSTESDHNVPTRLTLEEYRELIEVDQTLVRPPPKVIGIFDDVLTTGKHFVAIKGLLQETFPGVSVLGFFFARREILVETF